MARDYTKIKAWQLADDFAVAVYQTTKRFPREETYGLTSQVRRAASSTPANIAEGSNRTSKKDYLHFLSIALGSLAEAKYFLHLAKRLGYIDEMEYCKLAGLGDEAGKTLGGLISAIQKEIAIRTTTLILVISALALPLLLV
jgi:four helix bundle protein